MDVDTAKKLLSDNGKVITGEDRIMYGTQIRLDGVVVNVYDKGTHQVQGGDPESVEAVREILRQPTPSSKTPASNKIFVVYGHDEEAKRDTEVLLRKCGLEPLFLDQLPSSGGTIIETLERYTKQAQYAVVLVTPDDEGHQAGHPDKKRLRMRQNVVLELGMMLGLLGRGRVAILIKKPDEMEVPSDIRGFMYITFEDKIEEVKVDLAKELDAAGYNISVSQL